MGWDSLTPAATAAEAEEAPAGGRSSRRWVERFGVGSREHALPQVLREYWISTILLTLIAFVVCSARNLRILMPPAHRFADILCYKERMLRYGSAAFFEVMPGKSPWTNTAPIALLYRALYWTGHPVGVFLATAALILGLGAWAMVHELVRCGVRRSTAVGFLATAVASSYPVWWLIECANMELYVFLCIGLGSSCYLRGKGWWSAGLFGIAAAIKLYPVLFLALFFSRREYRRLIFGLGLAVGVYLLCNWMVGPTLAIALAGNRKAMEQYQQGYILGARAAELGFDHSLFTIVKQTSLVEKMRYGIQAHISLLRWYQVYMMVCGTAASFGYVFWIRKLPKLNRVMILTLLSLLLPPVSWDYRLVHLYVPWAFLVLFVITHPERRENALVLMFFGFAILFTPQNYLTYYLGRDGVGFLVTYAGQLKAVVMLGLAALAMRVQLSERDLASPEAEA